MFCRYSHWYPIFSINSLLSLNPGVVLGSSTVSPFLVNQGCQTQNPWRVKSYFRRPHEGQQLRVETIWTRFELQPSRGPLMTITRVIFDPRTTSLTPLPYNSRGDPDTQKGNPICSLNSLTSLISVFISSTTIIPLTLIKSRGGSDTQEWNSKFSINSLYLKNPVVLLGSAIVFPFHLYLYVTEALTEGKIRRESNTAFSWKFVDYTFTLTFSRWMKKLVLLSFRQERQEKK